MMTRLRALWDRMTGKSGVDVAELLARRRMRRPINWSEQRRAAPWYLIR
jgi:hypothetical protein